MRARHPPRRATLSVPSAAPSGASPRGAPAGAVQPWADPPTPPADRLAGRGFPPRQTRRRGPASLLRSSTISYSSSQVLKVLRSFERGLGGNNGQGVESDRFGKEPTMELGLEGKVALVTGGSKGVGRGVADALAAEGCHVCICSRDEQEVRRAAEEIEDAGAGGARVLAVAAGLTEGEDRGRLVDEIREELGAIDILVNNAGTVGGGGTLEDTSLEAWRSLFELNLCAAVDLIKRVVPGMQERGWRRIVNISSENGTQPYPDMISYSASKALSKQYAADGILVNTVSPAFIESPLVSG